MDVSNVASDRILFSKRPTIAAVRRRGIWQIGEKCESAKRKRRAGDEKERAREVGRAFKYGESRVLLQSGTNSPNRSISGPRGKRTSIYRGNCRNI